METVKLFQLVEFTSKGRKKNGLKTIDIVSTTWIVEGSQGKLFARFIPPPYTGQNVKKLETMVEQLEEAPGTMPSDFLAWHHSRYLFGCCTASKTLRDRTICIHY